MKCIIILIYINIMKYNFQERINKLLSFDKIRLYKIIEIIEYSIIFFILIICISFIWNNIYYKYKNNINIFSISDESNDLEKKNLDKETFIELFFITLFQTILIVIIFFYLRKIVLLFPSIISIYDKQFKPYTTFNYLNNVALVFLFMHLIPQYSYNIEKLRLKLIKV
jgi:hypothetical protein